MVCHNVNGRNQNLATNSIRVLDVNTTIEILSPKLHILPGLAQTFNFTVSTQPNILSTRLENQTLHCGFEGKDGFQVLGELLVAEGRRYSCRFEGLGGELGPNATLFLSADGV